MPAEPGQLLIYLQDQVIQTITLSAPVMTIGRTPDHPIALQHPLVSRRHAELRLDPQGLLVTDLGSSNGTFINGEQLLPDQPRLLAPSAALRIGPYVLVYQPAGASDRPEELPAPPEPALPVVTPEPAAPVAVPEQQPVAAAEPAPAAPSGPPAPVAMPIAAADAIDIPDLAIAPPGATVALVRGNGKEISTGPAPLMPARKRAGSYLAYLPIIFQDNEFLGRYLGIFETIWEPLEQRQDRIAMYFDPRTCPESFLPWLASWFGLELNERWPAARRRRLLAEATELYRWRGTRYGLTRVIEVCTGLHPDIVEDPQQPFVFRISLTIPPGSDITRELIEDLINTHKPAHAGYILEFRP